MTKGDLQRLQHIKTYCNDIAGFIERFGNSIDIFTKDRAYFNAVSMCVLQIGELANGLSSVVWETATNDIPKLLDFCKTEISNNVLD